MKNGLLNALLLWASGHTERIRKAKAERAQDIADAVRPVREAADSKQLNAFISFLKTEMNIDCDDADMILFLGSLGENDKKALLTFLGNDTEDTAFKNEFKTNFQAYMDSQTVDTARGGRRTKHRRHKKRSTQKKTKGGRRKSRRNR
jgi:hypothetical protein